ncbi:MAG: hypothetical protein ABMA13_18935 [Chthoniobacteraceae bacterium]
MRQTPDGTVISGPDAVASWDHPFRVSLIGDSGALITPGFVNLIEAEIDGEPLSAEPAPKLEWNRPKLDADRRGYIAIEVECDEKWNVKKTGVKLVQVGYLSSENGTDPPPDDEQSAAGGVPSFTGRRARWPLAMLRQRKDGGLGLFQITHGDLQFRAQPRSAKVDFARCFFW